MQRAATLSSAKAFPNELSLSHLKIVVDCANGATYHIAECFRNLSFKSYRDWLWPDGLNINEEVGATDVRALQARVLAEKADLGIAFDGDGDRVIMVDHEGNKVDGTRFCTSLPAKVCVRASCAVAL